MHRAASYSTDRNVDNCANIIETVLQSVLCTHLATLLAVGMALYSHY